MFILVVVGWLVECLEWLTGICLPYYGCYCCCCCYVFILTLFVATLNMTKFKISWEICKLIGYLSTTEESSDDDDDGGGDNDDQQNSLILDYIGFFSLWVIKIAFFLSLPKKENTTFKKEYSTFIRCCCFCCIRLCLLSPLLLRRSIACTQCSLLASDHTKWNACCFFLNDKSNNNNKC